MNYLLRPRIWPSFSPSRKPGVLGCRPLRRTVQVRLGFDFGFRILDFCLQMIIANLTAQISRLALSLSQTFKQIFNPHSAIRIPQSSTRWLAHLHVLATVIDEISGLTGEGPCQASSDHPKISLRPYDDKTGREKC